MSIEAEAIDLTSRQPGTAPGEGRIEVREVALPPGARALATLRRIDYTDALLLETRRAEDRTGEEWARAILEDAPAAMRSNLRRGWFALGVRLGSTEDRRLVLGWTVRRSTPDHALLAARSVFGMEAEVLIKRERHGVLGATLMQLNNPVVRVFWAGFSFQHRRVLRHLLTQTGRRVAAELSTSETAQSPDGP